MLALLYDAHGNLPALEAVLEDAADRGATGYVIGGDVALFGAWPMETVGRLRRLENARWLRGNGERWTAQPDEAPDNQEIQAAIEACRAALGETTVADLARLPQSVALGELDARAWHASPVSDVRSLFPEPADDEGELLAGVSEKRLFFGHTHLQFRRAASGPGGAVELVNPGSVGMPFDGDPRAGYALVHPDGTVESRRVAYDHAASAAAVGECFGDAAWTRMVASRIENARP